MVRRHSQPDDRPPSGKELSAVPAGAPAWVTAELIQETIRVWQPYYADPLTADDALAIILGVGRLFEVLSRGAEP
jgi:hypothetical protein